MYFRRDPMLAEHKNINLAITKAKGQHFGKAHIISNIRILLKKLEGKGNRGLP